MNKKVILFFLFPLFLLSFNIAKASGYDELVIEKIKNFVPNSNFDVKKDIGLTEENLGIDKIEYLPNQLTYSVNNVLSNIDMVFTINKLEKINKKIDKSLKNVKEIELCYKLNDNKCVDKALKEYKSTKISLYKEISNASLDYKKYILEKLLVSEINQNIILDNIQRDYTYNIDTIKNIQNINIDKLGAFIASSDIDQLSIKQTITLAINSQNEGKSILNKILINNFLDKLKLRTNILIKPIIEDIIQNNYIDVVKNINRLNIEAENIDIEKNIEYYLYKIYNNDPLYEVHLIDTLYSIQNNIENSKIKDLVKISIINARQIPMSLLNMTLEKIDPLKLDSEINRLLTGDDIDKMNLILLLEKYTNTSGIIIYKLDELKESYQNNIISDLINLNNDQKEIKLKQYVDKLSYENLGFIKDILKILEEDATSNANPEFAIVSGRILDLVAKKGIITNKICSNYYEPVCGADNVTYDNECFIEKVGIDIKYRAECRIEENTKLKPITEEDLKRGWYYGTKETKKPSTPLNWILIDENTKYSKWIDPQKTIILKKQN